MEENLWVSILSEVRQKATSKLPTNKNLLVLGNNGSGKTTLVAKLQGVETPRKGSGLEYAYIDVRDDYRDDNARLGVWILDGDPSLGFLLKFALDENTYEDTTVVLVVSMTTPWNILDELQSWASVLQDHIDRLNITSQKMEDCRHNCIRMWNNYVELADDMDESVGLKRSSRLMDEENNYQLGEGVLVRNIGLDVVVVVTKTDYVARLEKDFEYKDEHLDFIQQWIRRFCLQYGASLFYTSAKEDKNCDLLYKYLTHRIYDLPFQAPALIVEKDAVFVPSGWDSMKKISILFENIQSMKPDDYYRDVIVPPLSNRKTIAREVEIVAEEEQSFLSKQHELQQQTTPSASNVRPDIALPFRNPQANLNSRLSVSPSVQSQTPTRRSDGNPNEGVLATFFNSLLNKKTPKSNESTPSASSLRTDAAVELEKLSARRMTPHVLINPTSLNNTLQDSTQDSITEISLVNGEATSHTEC